MLLDFVRGPNEVTGMRVSTTVADFSIFVYHDMKGVVAQRSKQGSCKEISDSFTHHLRRLQDFFGHTRPIIVIVSRMESIGLESRAACRDSH